MSQKSFINKDVYIKTFHGGYAGTTNTGIEELKLFEPNQQCRFTIVDAGNDTIAFKTYDGEYISANNSSSQYNLTTVAKINAWERFQIFKINDKYSIYSTAHNSYFSSFKHRVIRASAAYSRSTEYFEIVPFPKVTKNKNEGKGESEDETETEDVAFTKFIGSKIMMKTSHDSYVRADARYYPDGYYGRYDNPKFGGIKQEHSTDADHLCQFEVVDAGNNCVAFKSYYDKYLSASNENDSYNMVFADEINSWEKFKLIKNEKGWNIYSPTHNKYLSADGNNNRISASANKTRGWELFEIIEMPKEEKIPIIMKEEELIGSDVYIKTYHERYMVYHYRGIQQIDTLVPSVMSQFKIVDAGNGCVAFQCANEEFISAYDSNSGYKLDTVKKVNSWEMFKVIKNEDKWSIYSPVHEKYIRAYTDEKISCDADKPLGWETFEIIKVQDEDEDGDDTNNMSFNLKNHIFLPNMYRNGVAAFKISRGERVYVAPSWDEPLKDPCQFAELLYYLRKYGVVICYRKGKRVYLSEDINEKVQVDWVVPFTEQKEVKRSYYDKAYIVLTDNVDEDLYDQYRGMFVYPDFIHQGDKLEINKGMVERFLSQSKHKQVDMKYKHHDFEDDDYTWDNNLHPKTYVNAFLNLKNYAIKKKLDATQVDNCIAHYEKADRPDAIGIARNLCNVISYYNFSIGVAIDSRVYMLKSGYGIGEGKFWIQFEEKINGGRNFKLGDSSSPFNFFMNYIYS